MARPSRNSAQAGKAAWIRNDDRPAERHCSNAYRRAPCPFRLITTSPRALLLQEPQSQYGRAP